MGAVSIIGTGAGWEAAPATVLSWGVNGLLLQRGVDMVFNMHDLHRGYYQEIFAESMTEIKSTGTPFMGLEKYDFLPSSQEYPLQAVMAKFNTDYFANGICYMIAYALFTGKTQIDLYGVNMTSHHEYRMLERPCIEYWIGRAEGMGVKCTVHGLHSKVLCTSDSRLYGYGCFQMSTLFKEDADGKSKCIQRSG